ncbi:MAG: tyrosine-type recombinase/integrase, partial [Gammaproteobacteria bacterium]|nr:tyrosine-type recombinase/integrase [Gammaproteobacteria bacterium]
MLDELFKRFDGAYAENTLRAYRSDMMDFMEWCDHNDFQFDNLAGEDLARYVEDLSRSRSTATIRRRLMSISSVMSLAQLTDNTRHPDVKLTMKRIHRQKGRAQLQASPLTRDVKAKLLEVCSADTRGLRDRVLLELGYETMRRRAELCAFKFEDRVTSPSGQHGLIMQFSKTDQFGRGKIISISDELSALLDEWQAVAGDSGYILRGITPDLSLNDQLSHASVNIILKRLQAEAELDIQPSLSGHSFRVGRALDLLNEGESLPKIMLRGGWSAES